MEFLKRKGVTWDKYEGFVYIGNEAFKQLKIIYALKCLLNRKADVKCKQIPGYDILFDFMKGHELKDSGVASVVRAIMKPYPTHHHQTCALALKRKIESAVNTKRRIQSNIHERRKSIKDVSEATTEEDTSFDDDEDRLIAAKPARNPFSWFKLT